MIETQGDSSTLKPKHEKLLGSKKKITKTTKPKDQAELDQEVQQIKILLHGMVLHNTLTRIHKLQH
mgnify:CR=1 FL=1